MQATTLPDDAKTRLNAWAVHSFIQAAVKTFDIQCQYPIKYESSLALNARPNFTSDIIAVIGLTSDVFCGSIVLCFQEKFFLATMSKMFGEKYETISSEIVDGAGEILNIIFGVAKTTLSNEGYSVSMSIPSVLSGTKLSVSSVTSGGESVLLNFGSESGPFNIVVSFSSNKGQPLPKRA